jgi:uncharacterized protein YndB with AHSA1/START domain
MMATETAPAGARADELAVQPGALFIRRSIQINASPARVWREFESFERFSAWWTTSEPGRREGVTAYEPRVGARVEMPCGWDGGSCVFAGTVTSVVPEREITWDFEVEGGGWPARTFVTVRLTANAYGTLVEILHYGFERLGELAIRQFSDFEGGWDLRELRALRDAIEAAS